MIFYFRLQELYNSLRKIQVNLIMFTISLLPSLSLPPSLPPSLPLSLSPSLSLSLSLPLSPSLSLSLPLSICTDTSYSNQLTTGICTSTDCVMAAYKLINALSVGCIENVETVSRIIVELFYSGQYYNLLYCIHSLLAVIIY